LRAQAAALRPAKVLLIRRRERDRGSVAVFHARSRPGLELLTRLELGGYEELLGLDFACDPPPGRPVEHPLFLVCTHGKHDRCCALYGKPLFDALADQADEDWAWQVTHIGGDRFAGNVVVLPEGLYYGRVAPAAAPRVVDAHLARRIDLDSYRGRCSYSFAAQAAEAAVRRELDLTGIDDIALESETRTADGWAVAFRAAEGAVHERNVVAELGQLTYLTCDATTLKRPRRYRALVADA
jgi:hypothetical protein